MSKRPLIQQGTSATLIQRILDLLTEDHVQNNKGRMGALGADNIDSAVRRLEELLSRDPLFRIRPLKWTRDFNDFSQTWQSDSAHGDYKVTRHKEPCERAGCLLECDDLSHQKWGQWRWEYCFVEYKNEETTECATVAEGKQKAEEHWRNYLMDGLEQINGPLTRGSNALLEDHRQA